MQNQLDKAELCPCGTGLSYGECCWDKEFKWIKDDEGNVFRTMPIGSETEGTLKDAKEDFARVFGRPPEGEDPLFLVKYLASDFDVRQNLTKIMEDSGTRPELVYAFQKTGLLLSEENYARMPQSYIEEWEEAVDEYFRMEAEGLIQSRLEAAISDLEDELDNLAIAFGYTLEYGYKEDYERELSFSSLISIDDYLLICAERSFTTLRSIRYLLERRIGTDSLALARSIYEGYLHIAYVSNNPERLADLVDATCGLKTGTHEYKKTKKGHNRRIIVCKETSKEYKGSIAKRTMSRGSHDPVDGDLFDSSYEFLSEFTHTGLSLDYLSLSLSEDKKGYSLDPLSNGLSADALLYSTFFSVLVLDRIAYSDIICSQTAVDIRTVIRRAVRRIMYCIDEMAKTEYTNYRFEIMKKRLANVALL